MKIPSIWKNVEQVTFSCITSMNTKWLLWKTVWQFLFKLNIYLSYKPAIWLLGIYPREVKTKIDTKYRNIYECF